MANVTVSKLKANLLSDKNTGDKQVIESTLFPVLESIFMEYAAIAFTNKTGSTDAVGNITYTKIKILEHIDKDFAQVGDLTRFKDIETDKIYVVLDKVIEHPVRYYSNELEMAPEGILAQVQQGIQYNIGLRRQLDIVQAELDAATANGNIVEFDLTTATKEDLEKFMDEQIIALRNTKDTGIAKVPVSKLVLRLSPTLYLRLLQNKLIIPNGTNENLQSFAQGSFLTSLYKGVMLVEDQYLTDVDDAMLGVIHLNGAIASPWRMEGTANDKVPGESSIYLLNTQVRFKTQAIYPKHIVVIKQTTITLPARSQGRTVTANTAK